jgi:hypothetical protein
VEAIADVWRDDDAPPESGVRPRPSVAIVLRPRRAPASQALSRDVLAEVGEEVFFEVWGIVRALSPLQGAWLRLGLGQLGAALLTAADWPASPRERPLRVLRERWPELVPGYAAVDRLAGLMVDRICG